MLPADPEQLGAARAAAACRALFEARDDVIADPSLDVAIENLHRARAIEAYVRSRSAKAEAMRAMRVLETAVGVALGPAEQGQRTDLQPSLMSDSLAALPRVDRHRFRLMAERRELWWRELAERPLSRKQVLDIIARADAHPASHDCATTTVADLSPLIASGTRFGCIYADPPWQYDNQGTRAATSNHYSGLTVDQLCALPVRDLAADDAHLHLWTTNAFLFECPRIFAAWGFEFRSSFVWVKSQIGIGNYWRNSHEFLLTAIRGNAKRFNDRTLRSWIEVNRGAHSAKPEQVRSMLMRASPGPYLEMFGRQVADGWTVWGNQIDRSLFAHAMEAA
jgi:N6-adenosine-specific RNA methylase IME4